MNQYDSVLFDLDGTLWDETEITEQAWVEVLARHPGVVPAAPLNRDTICRYMGLTNEELAGVLFPALPFEEAFSLMKETCAIENRELPRRGGKLYPGVPETLARLCAEGYRLFVISNAQDGYIESFLTAHRMWDIFEDYESSGRSGKGKADNIKDMIARRGLTRPVYVGDTVSDAEGAAGAGVPFIYCLYGFGEAYGRGRVSGYAHAVKRFDELPRVLLEAD